MDDTKIIESRKITKEEYDAITGLINKYKLNPNNFINNCKTLVLNRIEFNGNIFNGYNPEKNTISYNDKSNIIRELIHVASSTKSAYQGICIKPNKVFPESMGIGLNEGITDMFLELYNKEEGEFPFEKICAEVLKHVFGVKLFNYYFNNNDGGFRFFFRRDISTFLIDLDEYFHKMMYAKYLYHKDGKITRTLELSIKVLMTVIIDDLISLIGSDEKNRKYLFNKLKSKTMKPIYDIIGEYNYEDYHR